MLANGRIHLFGDLLGERRWFGSRYDQVHAALGAGECHVEETALFGVRERIGVGEHQRKNWIIGDAARKAVAANRQVEDDNDIGLESLGRVYRREPNAQVRMRAPQPREIAGLLKVVSP